MEEQHNIETANQEVDTPTPDTADHSQEKDDDIATKEKSVDDTADQSQKKDDKISDGEPKEKSVDHILTDSILATDKSPAGEETTNNKVSTTSASQDDDQYAKYVTYNEKGEAIYTDPKTQYKYKWSNEENNWIPAESSEESASETEFYKWCPETNKWIPKTDITAAQSETETEFYKWDAVKNEWVPKNESKNVTYCAEADTYTYTDSDGTAFLWDKEKNAWFPNINDDFIAHYQLQYGVSTEQPAVENESTEDKPNAEKEAAANVRPTGKRPAEPPKWFEIAPEQNTKVYVNNLPLDITEDEFVELMSKCGMIMRDPQNKKHKVKLYNDSNGQFKGDALCDYIKVESVQLALNILDGYDVRGKKISVQRAKFQMRGEYNPSLKPKVKKKDKEKLQKMKEKLFDWRPELLRGQRLKHEKVVIIKNLFTRELFEKEVQLIIEYQKDMREECAKYGTVRKVVLYDRHPEGVAQVTMATPEEADAVVEIMNGRFFGKRQLVAEIWDGKTKYKIAETDAEVEKRIGTWSEFLETSEPMVKGEIAAKDSSTDDLKDKPEDVVKV